MSKLIKIGRHTINTISTLHCQLLPFTTPTRLFCSTMASAAGEGGGASMALSREASALYRVRKTVCKMLKNR